MILYATTHRVGDSITTDQILAPEHRESDDPAVLAAECLAVVDPALAEQVREGDVLLTGANFGAGAAPDAAVLALQALGFVALICASVGPDFVAAAHASGLPVLVAPEAAAALPPGTIVRIDLAGAEMTNRAIGERFTTSACPPEVIEAVRRTQLLLRMRRVVEEEGFDG